MSVRESFRLEFPEGYIPVVRPKSWAPAKNSYCEQPHEFEFNKKDALEEIDPIVWITKQLASDFVVTSVCTQQMAKYPSADFIVEIDSKGITSLKHQLGKPLDIRQVNEIIKISCSNVLLYQRNMKFSR